MKLLCSLNISTLLRFSVAVSVFAGVETARMREEEERGMERALREIEEAAAAAEDEEERKPW